MDLDTAKRLIEINHQFYQTFAGAFSITRQRIQPGVRRLIERIPPKADLLDLGCGNGALWHVLQRQRPDVAYTGLDFSAELLQRAGAIPEATETPKDRGYTLILADLSTQDWDQAIQTRLGERVKFDIILAYAVLHHLPGAFLRGQVLRRIHGLLKPGGQFFHSEWQFLNSPRLRARIQQWGTIGLTENLVDPGDYLIDWRSGGYGLRYVHHFDEMELSLLAEENGFQVIETFYSDGEDARLGLYQVWEMRE
jgi:SAM-dependent methyltransferase